jgi:hypothetical protein
MTFAYKRVPEPDVFSSHPPENGWAVTADRVTAAAGCADLTAEALGKAPEL